MSGGFFLVVSYFFYFKALFKAGDAALIQILYNTIAVVVPILAFVLLQEKLSLMQYGGIAIAFIGVTTLAGDGKTKNEKFWPTMLIMSGAVIFFALNMIFTRELYVLSIPFYSVILFYSLGGVMGGLFFLVLRIRKYSVGNLLNIGKKYIGWFVFSELIVLGGIVASQRAIEISPAVSLVAVIESFQPAFIVILSALIFLAFRFFLHKYADLARKIYNDQLSGLAPKIIAIIIMAFGIYLINL
jgi:drug/metabolite transporter (DMT)-like permease